MMIYICGIHGVGKTYFCDRLHKEIGALTFTASKLIQKYGHIKHRRSKYIIDQAMEEKSLVAGVQIIKSIHKKDTFALDSHLCLLNSKGKPTRITYRTMTEITPNFLVLLTEDIDIIAYRRKKRDGIVQERLEIEALQTEEIEYANELSKKIDIPLIVSKGSYDVDVTFAKVARLFEN